MTNSWEEKGDLKKYGKNCMDQSANYNWCSGHLAKTLAKFPEFLSNSNLFQRKRFYSNAVFDLRDICIYIYFLDKVDILVKTMRAAKTFSPKNTPWEIPKHDNVNELHNCLLPFFDFVYERLNTTYNTSTISCPRANNYCGWATFWAEVVKREVLSYCFRAVVLLPSTANATARTISLISVKTIKY